MKIYVIEGGIGKHVCFTAVIPKLAEKEKIMIMSSYPDLFQNNPHVHRSLARNSQYIWEDTVKKEENIIIYSEPYYQNDFIKGKISLIEAWCNDLAIEYNPNMQTKLYPSKQLFTNVQMFKKENNDFIIVQFTGGQSPLTVSTMKWEQLGQKKTYPPELAQKLIDSIKETCPKLTILNFTLPNEYSALTNCIRIDAPYLLYAALLQEAKTFIAIDSSLQHMATAMDKKGIVLWGGTSPKAFGSNKHINLVGECPNNNLHCSRPYVKELGDFVGSGQPWECDNPTCMNIAPEKIIEELNNIC